MTGIGIPPGWPDTMPPELTAILGRPNFQCGRLADVLRLRGWPIDRKAEHEQAAVIFWLLRHWFEAGDQWRRTAAEEIDRWAAERAAELATQGKAE